MNRRKLILGVGFLAASLTVVGKPLFAADGDLRDDGKDIHQDRRDIRNDTKDIRQDRKDLVPDVKDIRSDRKELRDELKNGPSTDQIAKDRADTRQGPKELQR